MIDLGALLQRVEDAAPVDAVPVVATTLGDMLGAREVTFLVTDFSGRSVIRLTTSRSGARGSRSSGVEHAEPVPLPGTVYEQVLRTQQPSVERLERGTRVVVPVTDRGDAIGLIELDLPRSPSGTELADVRAAAHALAYILIAARRHTDLFEWGQRSIPFSLAAEIQRRLLPASYTCEAGQFTLAGWLEPASSVGGDTFDYTLDRDSLQLSITDAVGHQVQAALLATLLVGGLRNARRRDLDLPAQAAYASDALAANAEPGHFVTGQVLRVDLATGSAAIVNAGHPLPLCPRDGKVTEIPLEVEPPFGVVPGRSYRAQPLLLHPGDRLVLLTDGMQERNAASLDVAATLADSRELHPREVVLELGAAVLAATGGDLRDDATMVCLDWHGGPRQRRDSEYGADQGRASAAR